MFFRYKFVDISEFEEGRESRCVFTLLDNVIFRLERIPPNGATIHKFNNLYGYIRLFSQEVLEYPAGINFNHLKKDDPRIYQCVIIALCVIQEKFNIYI